MEFKEVKVIQGSDQWRQCRIGKITGSNFQTIMNTPKQRILPFNDTQKKYLYQVVAEIFTGVEEEEYSSYWMDRGIEVEPFAADAYAKKHDTIVKECGFFQSGEYIGVSPDRIVGLNEKVLEIKSPKAATHVKYMDNTEELFKAYQWQVIGEALATGINETVIISYHPDFPDDKQIVEYEYTVTAEDLDKLKTRLSECTEFIEGMIA